VQLTAGIISYNPDVDALVATCRQLREENIHVLVIDNASREQAALATAVLAQDGVEWLPQQRNLGIAAAFNLLHKHARKAGSACVMALDQDSQLEPGHCGRLLEQFSAARQGCPRLGALGATIYDQHRRRRNSFKRFRPSWNSVSADLPPGLHRADFLISSGTLVAMDCLQDTGLMNEWLFIDSVDLDWCFRATQRKWVLAGADEPVQVQAIGKQVLSFAGFSTRIRQHDPERYYTMTRNRRFLYHQAYTPWLWAIRDLPRALGKYLLLLLISPQRKAIASAHWRGLRAPLSQPGSGVSES
jgi:rhamnosyltransferase